MGRRQRALRPGLPTLDPVQHAPRRHHRLRRVLHCRGKRTAAQPVRQPCADRRPGRVRRHHPLAHATARHQCAALGAHRRRFARARHVPAQRTSPATGPSAARRGGVRRVRIPHGLLVRRLRLAADRLDEAVGLHGCRCGGVRRCRPRAVRGPSCRAVRAHRRRRWLGPRRVGRRRDRAWQLPRCRLRHGRARGDPRRALRPRASADGHQAAAHRAALPFVDLRGAGDGVHRDRPAGTADPDDLPLVPQPKRTPIGRVGQLHPDLHQQEFGQLRRLGEHLHESALLSRAGAVRPRDPHRRDRGSTHEAALRGWPELVRSDPGRLLHTLVPRSWPRFEARSSTTSGGSSS